MIAASRPARAWPNNPILTAAHRSLTPFDAKFSLIPCLQRCTGRVARLLRMLTVTASCLLAGASLHAADEMVNGTEGLPEITSPQSIRLPADLSQVDFYLVTVDVGDNIWDNFGHTALRVVDRSSNSDLVFNWGLFDASVGNVTFASNFFQGILNYQLGVSPPAWEFGRYEREQRSVWQDHLNLTTAQKATLYRRLAWNLREENIVYSYQYFFDNCTTRVRDYLDEALGGRLAEQSRAQVPRTFRDEVLSHYATVPTIAVSLDILMNERIDRRMTRWESMFLPATLRTELLAFSSDVMSGVQRQPLLDEPQVVMEFTPPAAGPNAYHVLGAALAGAVLFLFLTLKRIPISSFSSRSGFTLRLPALSYRVMGIMALLLCLVGGSYGLIMAAAWRESEHLDLHNNLNLLLFWPTDILGLLFSLRWLISGRVCQLGKTTVTLIKLYLLLHLFAAIGYVFVALAGIASQDVVSLLIFVVPALMGFAVLVWNAGFSAIRRISFS
jgi:hypothetical protein